MELQRNAALTGLLTLATLFTSVALFAWMAIGATLIAASIFSGRSRRVTTIIAAVVFVVSLCVCGGVVTNAIRVPAPNFTSPLFEAYAEDLDALTGNGSFTVIALALLVVLLFALLIEYSFTRARYRILTNELAHNTRHTLPPLPAGRAGKRVQAVAAAQFGNVTLGAHRDPFLGAGRVTHGWSMCLKLASRSRPGVRVELDPVDLHASVRAHLEAMRQHPLPDREKISGLVIRDHIVANGDRHRSDLLIDQAHAVPFSDASREAIEAIIRHPQGSLRYYLRAIVGAEGRDVVAASNRPVASAQDQQVAVSTFLYLAVEGGMLYAEIVAALLGPIGGNFHRFDRVAPDSIGSEAFRHVLPRFVPDFLLAPYRLVHEIAAGGYARRMEKEARLSQEAFVYDYGPWLSARQLASTQAQNYLQALDGEKYYKLAERTITEALLSYLRDHDVDTAEFESRVSYIHNIGVMITGGTVSGPVAGGQHAAAAVTAA